MSTTEEGLRRSLDVMTQAHAAEQERADRLETRVEELESLMRAIAIIATGAIDDR